jgi:hypothetical protein
MKRTPLQLYADNTGVTETRQGEPALKAASCGTVRSADICVAVVPEVERAARRANPRYLVALLNPSNSPCGSSGWISC